MARLFLGRIVASTGLAGLVLAGGAAGGCSDSDGSVVWDSGLSGTGDSAETGAEKSDSMNEAGGAGTGGAGTGGAGTGGAGTGGAGTGGAGTGGAGAGGAGTGGAGAGGAGGAGTGGAGTGGAGAGGSSAGGAGAGGSGAGGSSAGGSSAGGSSAGGSSAGGSGGSTATQVCTSGVYWQGLPGPNMDPGDTCQTCHSTFQVAGTVYPTADEPTDCNGVPGDNLSVVITDADGNVQTLTVNDAGNFYSTQKVVFPFHAKVISKTAERDMVLTQSTGDCNYCHSPTGMNGAPGRIMSP
jgi:hypothetical protein